MENFNLPDKPPALALGRTTVEVVLADDDSPLALVSPPIDDISEMAEIGQMHFSLKEGIANKQHFQLILSGELESFSRKAQRFESSATFRNRFANIFNAVGKTKAARSHWEAAWHLSEDPFFARKIGDLDVREGNVRQAEELFLALTKDPDDSYAALRMAYFAVHRGDLQLASEWVKKAVDANPTGYAERLFQGALSLVQGRHQESIGYLRLALEERPTSSSAYCNMGLAYIALEHPERAFESLKRAVALDPFNVNALIALSDVAAFLQKDADVISPLRYYIEFEQKQPHVWGRFARTLLNLNLMDECLAALKSQGALDPSPAIWNNIGVAYSRKHQHDSALKAFKYALSLESEDKVKPLLVGRNIVQLFASQGRSESVIIFSESLFKLGSEEILSNDRLADTYSFYIHALSKLGREQEARNLCLQLLTKHDIAHSLSVWLVSMSISFLSLSRFDDQRLLTVMRDFESLREHLTGPARIRLSNNFAFAFAELGLVREADRVMSEVANYIHADAYLTATAGLINLKKGRWERGVALYKEAISLARSSTDKARIRQKYYMERGKWLASGSKMRSARRYLERAASEKLGEQALAKQADDLLRSISRG